MAKRKSNLKDPDVELVESLIAFGMKGKEDCGVITNYNRGIQYWRGNHKISENSAKTGNKVYNKFAEIIETRLSHLTDAKPKWLFRPQETNDIQIAHALNQIMGDVIWDYIDWDHGEDGGGKGEDAILQAAFAGSCHIKTVLDIDTGYPNFVVIPAGAIIVDPKAKKKKQLRYWIHLVPTSIKHIKRQYGVDVQPQADLERIYDHDRADFHRPQITGQLDSTNDTFPSLPYKIDGKGGQSDYSADQLGKAIIAECWMQDWTMEAIPYDAKETSDEHNAFKMAQPVFVTHDEHHPKHIAAHTTFMNKLDAVADAQLIQQLQEHIATHERFPQDTSRLKYPYGRVITVCQGKKLLDRPNPFGMLGLGFRDVLIKFDYNKNPEAYWGKPLTIDLFDPQDDLNHRKNAITKNINLLNNGIRKIKWILYDKLGIKNNPRMLNNMPGNVVPFINSPEEFTTDFGKPMPNQVWVDLQWNERFMENQTNSEAVGSGRLPAAGTAGVTVETLLGEFKTILRKPLRHYAGALAEMGRNAVLIMSEFMDDNEKFMILGADQQAYEQINWGEIRDRARLMRNVRIDTANMLPTSRLETFRRTVELMQAGVPPEAAVQLLDDPKTIQIMQTMSKINQLTGMLEQMAQENKQLKEQVNTMVNRMQGNSGMGNVGIFK